MKKKLAAFMAVLFTLTTLTATAWAKTENSITKVIKVNKETVLSKNNAPKLIIEATPSQEESFTFQLKLTGAEWLEGKLDLQNGITSTRVSATRMIIDVSEDFDAAAEDIEIPLLTKITEKGDVEVTVDPLDSILTPGTYTFAQYIDGTISASIKEVATINGQDIIKDITITDNSVLSLDKGEGYALELSGGFQFIRCNTITGAGKYYNAVEFQIDEDDPTKATIVFTKNIPGSTGDILLSGLIVEPAEFSDAGEVILNIKLTGSGYEGTKMPIAVYERLEGFDAIIEIDDVNPYVKRPTITGTAEPKTSVEVQIDGESLGTTAVDEDGNYTMEYPEDADDLFPGNHTVTVGYYRSSKRDILYSVEKEYKQTKTEDIVITIGKDTYTIGKETFDLDEPAFLKNGRTLLPLRAIANALGVTDSRIDWNSEKREVTLSREDGVRVRIPVDSYYIYVSGEPQVIDASSTIKNGRTFLPLRAVANAFNISDEQIIWDNDAQTVTIHTVAK